MGQFIHSLHKSFVYFVKYVIILTVIALVPVPLLSFFGDQTLHSRDYHPLFQYYANENIELNNILENTYSNIYINKEQKQINQADIDNAILYADYLNYLLHQEQIPVVRKIIYTSKEKGSIKSIQATAMQYEKTTQLPEFKQIKSLAQSLIPQIIIDDEPKQWIILSLNSEQKQIQSQIKKLAKVYPNDNFLVISKTPINVNRKTFQSSIPEFDETKAKTVLVQKLKITIPQSNLVLDHFSNSLLQIKENGNDQSLFTVHNLLNDNYVDLSNISKNEKKILQQFCKTGKIKGKNFDVSNYGILFDDAYYWKDDLAKLNYELQSEKKCKQVKRGQKSN